MNDRVYNSLAWIEAKLEEAKQNRDRLEAKLKVLQAEQQLRDEYEAALDMIKTKGKDVTITIISSFTS